MEQYRGRKRHLYVVFIDLEKTYNKVSRGLLWRCLESKGVHVSYISLIKNMYDEAKTWGKRSGQREVTQNISRS